MELAVRVPSPLFSPTTSLSFFVTVRLRREKGFSCCDKGPLGSDSPATRPRAFPGTARPGPCGKLKATLASSLILQENGDLVTRPIQPDDVQRIVAHVAFSRAIRAHTLVFRPSSVSLLSHWVLWAAHFPFITQTRDVTSSPCLPSSAIECKAISAHCIRTSAEKKGMRMSALMKGLKVSLPGATAGSFSNQKEKELAVWPALPLHIPPNRLSPQTLEEASASHCKTLLPPTTRPRPPKRIFHTLQGFVQCHIWIFEVLFPKCSSCLVLRRCFLHAWSRSILLLHPWLPAFIFQRACAFWASCRFLTPTALLVSL